jgi:hypothetical protein
MALPLTASQIRQLRAQPVAEGGNRIEKAIELADIPHGQLAAAVDLTPSQVSDDIRGRYQTMRLDRAQRYARVFGCRVDDLFPANQAVA